MQNEFKDCKWSEVKAGDILKIKKDEDFPADLLLLYAPREIIFVDTVNLDGESSLKEKYVFHKEFEKEDIHHRKFQGKVICDSPNENLE